jgi:hypothetical protein
MRAIFKGFSTEYSRNRSMDQRAVLATICQLLPVKSFPQSGQVMKKLVLATAAAVACSSA